MRLSILLLLSLLPAAAQYTATRTIVDGVEVIRLEDRAHRTSVAIAPSIGNIAFEMLVNGHNLLWFPYSSVRRVPRQTTHLRHPTARALGRPAR